MHEKPKELAKTMLKFWNVIHCVFEHWTKESYLRNHNLEKKMLKNLHKFPNLIASVLPVLCQLFASVLPAFVTFCCLLYFWKFVGYLNKVYFENPPWTMYLIKNLLSTLSLPEKSFYTLLLLLKTCCLQISLHEKSFILFCHF